MQKCSCVGAAAVMVECRCRTTPTRGSRELRAGLMRCVQKCTNEGANGGLCETKVQKYTYGAASDGFGGTKVQKCTYGAAGDGIGGTKVQKCTYGAASDGIGGTKVQKCTYEHPQPLQ